MITLTLPKAINGDQLAEELGGALVWVNEEGLNIECDKSEEEIKAIVAKHKPVDFTATKAAEKSALLAKLGITEDEARLLLG
jgi:hypothetical protein